MTAKTHNTTFLLRLALCLNIVFICNYLLWAVCPPSHKFAVAIMLFLTAACLSLAKDLRNTWPALLFWILCLVLTLSFATDAWDARSIWMFHAKRIFLDNILYAQLDDYAPWSHNDYPVLYPALAATFARSVGLWNEVFPKAVVSFLYMPPLLILCVLYGNPVRTCALLLIVLGTCRAYLVNGYVDTLLAMYAVGTLLLCSRLTQRNNKKEEILHTALLASCLCVLMLLKNEGIVIALCIVSIGWMLHQNMHKKYAVGLAVALTVYIVSWKIPLLYAKVYNDIAVGGILERTLNRLTNVDAVAAIVFAMLKQSGVWFGLLLAGVFVMRTQLQDYNMTLCFVIAYTGVLFLVYLSSPHDLSWHLGTSVDRTMQPINLACFATLLNLSDRRNPSQGHTNTA